MDHSRHSDVAAGRYRLLRRLAVGGMAHIYLAEQSGVAGFAKQVVVKRILPQLAGNPDFTRMFLDEARLIATLHHPNIVQVHDIGVEGDVYFYVMEHLEGRDVSRLQAMLERTGERLPLEHAVSIVLGAAAGLHAAHEVRDPSGRPLAVVHRDVSPANLMVTFDGSVKLIDFGVAKAAHRTAETKGGVVKGKLAFMSPEQVRCQPIDRRSDVFALGAVLFELSTGTRLFDAGSEFEVMEQIVRRPLPRPSERVAGYPSALEAIVLRALARRPEDRFQTADDLFVALDQVAAELGLPLSHWTLGHYVRDRFEHAGDPDDDTAPAADTIDLAGPLGLDDDGLITVEEPVALDEATTAPSAARPGREPEVRVEFRRPRASVAPPHDVPRGTGPQRRLPTRELALEPERIPTTPRYRKPS